MRSGVGAVQQALAAEAAAVMRQAVSAARRRGHAQVTPLHVASAMLADAGGLLRAACLRSRAGSHPLQWKALELCLNVALSRLATAAAAASGGGAYPAVFGFQHAGQRAPPALSNALAAAFKRAHANQRRGGSSASSSSDGNHQQQAANKIELEQLVVSILDDPSVSRVMREAGFSSAEVKASVEKAAVSSEQSSNTVNSSSFCGGASPPNRLNPNTKAPINAKIDVAGDATRVLNCMAAGARCVAVVGESAVAAEAVVKAVMDTVSKGEDLLIRHERLNNLQFVPLSLASFQRKPREEVETRVRDLRALVRQGSAAGKGVVLVLEDLNNATDAWTAAAASRRRSSDHHYNFYCPVEHAFMELSRLVHGAGVGDHDFRFWLLAFGSYSSYTACRTGQPSLEAVLEMHPVPVPQYGALGLSLLGGGDSELTCCCTDMVAATPSSVIPSWLHRCQAPVLSGSELTLNFSAPAASSIRGFPHRDNLLDYGHLWLKHRHDGPGTLVESHDHQQWPASPNPAGSSHSMSITSVDGQRRRPKFTELTAENLKILCGALETRVPRHRGLSPGIASAVLQRRSGVITRTARPSSATWLVFHGPDGGSKTAMARELARLVFGSYDDFTTVSAAPITQLVVTTEPACSGSSRCGGDLVSHKRRRSPDETERLVYMQRFHDAVRGNPHRVFLIDGVEGLDDDTDSEQAGMMIKTAIATGTVRGRNGDAASLADAIVVLSCDALEFRSTRAPSPRRLKPVRVDMRDDDDTGGKEDDDNEAGAGKEVVQVQPRFSLDLNACATIEAELDQAEGSSPDHGVGIPDAVDGVFFFQY